MKIVIYLGYINYMQTGDNFSGNKKICDTLFLYYIMDIKNKIFISLLWLKKITTNNQKNRRKTFKN